MKNSRSKKEFKELINRIDGIKKLRRNCENEQNV